MIELIPLCSGIVEVAPGLAIGSGPSGTRSVSAITAARFAGDRLRAELVGAAAADWMVHNAGIGVIDVRMTLRTDDGALIYMQYGGRLNLGNMATGLIAHVAPVFETGDDRYIWLNAIQAVGKGTIALKDGAARIDYQFFALS